MFCFLLAGGSWGDITYFIPSKTRVSFIHFCVMQLSGCVAWDAGLATQENLEVYWQPQKEILLCKSGQRIKERFSKPLLYPMVLGNF